MLKKPKRLLADQRGDSLILALAALTMGTLLVAPLMLRVRSSYKVTEQIAATAERQYVSDAGVEMALWALENDAAFRQGLIDNELTSTSVSVAAIDDITPQVEAVCVSTTYTQTVGSGSGTTEYLLYAIFGNNHSRTQTVKLTGSGHTVNGAVHSNNDFKLTGSGHVMNGVVTFSGSSSGTSGHTFNPAFVDSPSPTMEFPISWDIDDFKPGGEYAVAAAAEGMYHEHYSRYKLSGSGYTVPPGLHYCYDDVNFSGSGVMGPNVTIVAEGKINISGSGHNYSPYVQGLTFFSDKNTTTNAIDISGSGNMGATCYAPKGKIALTGSGGTMIGAFIADRVQISGSGATIQLAQIPLPQSVPSVPVLVSATFDLRSSANGTTTTSRVEYNVGDEDEWQVLSWYIH